MASKFEIEAFVEVPSWHDVVSRPLFVEEIDPKGEKPVEVMAAYTFKNDEIRCGLKDCHQPHDYGFLVRTSKGNETNIGRICGRNIFGAEFTALANRFREKERLRTYKQGINAALERKIEVLARVETLKNQQYGANWLYRSLRNFRANYPADLVRNLTDRARRGEPVIEQVRERSKAEIEMAQVANPSANVESLRYETIRIGSLQGLDIFATDIRKILINQVEKQFSELDQLNFVSIKRTQLRELYSWAHSLDDTLAEAELLIGAGQSFFEPENLALLKYIPVPDKAREELLRIKWDYEAGDVIRRKR
jgi:hypothetical protein